ncbi:hypothetical protein D3C75_1253990 [compost metagenome]
MLSAVRLISPTATCGKPLSFSQESSYSVQISAPWNGRLSGYKPSGSRFILRGTACNSVAS